MSKIALMTIFQVPNYGSVLQTYATQCVLARLGHECKIINYKYPNEWHFNRGWERPNLYKSFRSRMARLLNKGNGKMENAVRKFRKRYMNFTKEFALYDELAAYDWHDTILVSGSDQVWNARYLKGDKAFMLGFAPADVRKVSLASSFASNSLPPEYMESYRKLLGEYSALSVREQNGVEIIKGQLGLPYEPYVMFDPTLLLSFDEWMQLTHTPERKENTPADGDYLLVYELTYSFDSSKKIAEALRTIASRYGCRTVVTLGDGVTAHHSAQGLTLDVVDKNGCSPEEFIRLFAGAKVVITNSFHGTAFAVNAGRPLVAVTPGTSDDRQVTLLNALGITSCAVSVKVSDTDINPEYDTQKAQALLAQKRQEDLAWIKNKI